MIAYELHTHERFLIGMRKTVTGGRGLHSFPFPLNLSLLRPFPLNLSLLCPPYNPIKARMCPEGAEVEL
jgi:hypothetical protein